MRLGSLISQRTTIDALYRAVLGRPADSDGLAHAASQLRGGEPLDRLIAGMLSSDEGRQHLLQRLATERPGTIAELDYPVRLDPRWGHGRPAHPEVARLLASGDDRYSAQLSRVVERRGQLAAIPVHAPPGSDEPSWDNDYLAGIDSAVLYTVVADANPRRYLEIGSGNSTMFVRRAIRDNGGRTHVTSIDPTPRATIDALADECIREPLETLDLARVSELEEGDILFYDGSHRVFTNSDATAFFMDVLPRVRPGVLVHIHDIFLPDDYPAVFAERWYSEQYLLMMMLLSGGMEYEVMFPSWYVQTTPALFAELSPLWDALDDPAVQRHGLSFWMRRLLPSAPDGPARPAA